MLEPVTNEEAAGCLGSILGSAAGGWLGLMDFRAHVERHLAEDPDAAVCGLPALAALGLGGCAGLFAGALLGMLICRGVSLWSGACGSSKTGVL